MLPLLDTAQQREYDLLTLLDSSDRWWTSTELTARTGLSTRTVHKYIHHLAQHLTHWPTAEIHLDTCSGQGTRLVKAASFNIRIVYAYYAEHSLIYTFFDAIFSKETLSPIDFCLSHYISPASLYRKLAPLRKVFQRFNLKLDVSSLQIKGTESQIRYFYYTLYQEIFRGYRWPFETASRPQIIRYIDSLCNQLDCPISLNEREQFAFWLAVILVRLRFSRRLPSTPFLEQLTNGNILYAELRDQLGQIFPCFSISPHETECQFIFSLLYAFPFLEAANPRLFAAAAISWTDQCLPLQAADLFENQFLQIFQLEALPHPDSFRMGLKRLHFHALLFQGNSDLLERYPVLNDFNHIFPRFARQLDTIYCQLQASPLQACFLDHTYLLPHYILLCSEHLHLPAYESPIRLRLFTDYGPIYESKIQQEIMNRFSSQFNLQIISRPSADYDILLTNLPETKASSEKLLINVHDAFNEREWNTLESFLKTIRARSTI